MKACIGCKKIDDLWIQNIEDFTATLSDEECCHTQNH